MGDDDDDEEDLQDVEDDAASLNTLETATTPGFVVDDEEQLRAVPNPKSKPRNYRLTRDWEYWPSAGELPHACSNAQQAQYGLMADLLFETMKVSLKLSEDTTTTDIVRRFR